MLLIVLDCLKGIQAQTAECIVIGEITTNKAIFVLNKIDLLPESERSARIKAATATLQKTLAKTRFKNAPIVSMGCLCYIRSLYLRRWEAAASRMQTRQV